MISDDNMTPKTDEADELHIAEVTRSLALVGQVWESDTELSVDDMCSQLDSVIDLIDGESNFEQFAESTNLTSCEKLN